MTKTDSPPSLISETEKIEKSDKFEIRDENKILAPISNFMADQFESVPLDNLPTGGPLEIIIISALDPDNIFFRFKKWVNEYLKIISKTLFRMFIVNIFLLLYHVYLNLLLTIPFYLDRCLEHK